MSTPSDETLSFHLEKTPGYQTMHADGVFGSLTPSGQGFLTFYIERSPIPKRIDYKVASDGGLSSPEVVESKTGIFRELHTGVILSQDGLIELRDNINRMLDEMAEDSDEG